MVTVRQFRLGEGFAAAVRSEIARLDLGRVFSCVFDPEERTIRLVLERSRSSRSVSPTETNVEEMKAHLRAYASVLAEVRSTSSRTAA